MRNIVSHAAEYFSDRGTVNKLYRQMLDFLGYFYTDVAGKISADNVVEQIHISKFYKAEKKINYSEGNNSGKYHSGKIICNKFAGPKIIELLNKFTKHLRRNNSEDYSKEAKTAG